MTQVHNLFTPAHWDEYARCYDALTELKPYQELVACMHENIPASATSILDIGCGTGTLLQRVTQTHPEATLTGIDRSEAMLNQAIAKLGDRANLLCASLAEACDKLTEQFSVVLSCNVLYATPNPAEFLAQLNSLLTPGGRFVIATPKKGFDNGLIIKAHCGDKRPDSFWSDPHSSKERERLLIGEAFGDSELAKTMRLIAYYNRKIAANASFHFYTEAELVALCRESGLQIERIELSYANQTQVVTGYKGER